MSSGLVVVRSAYQFHPALAVGKAMEWTKRASWIKQGRYTTQRPSKKLVGLLQPYRMAENLWREKILGKS
jgi:hypothetical protein